MAEISAEMVNIADMAKIAEMAEISWKGCHGLKYPCDYPGEYPNEYSRDFSDCPDYYLLLTILFFLVLLNPD